MTSISLNRAIGSFFMEGGGLSYNVDHHGCPVTKTFKKCWLKCPNIIGRFFSNFRFFSRNSSRKSQSQQNLTKNITHFTIHFCSKNLTLFTNLSLLDIENNMLPQCSQKSFWLYKFSSKHVSVWCQKKYLHCTISWCPRTAFLNIESKCLNNFLRVGRCLGLVDVLQFFISIEIFESSTIYQHFDTSIYSIKTLKFSRQFELQG